MQLYPNADAAIPVARLQAINQVQAMALDPCAPAFLLATQPVQIEIEGQRVAIAEHSDI